MEAPAGLLKLERLTGAELARHTFVRPVKRIHEGGDVSHFFVSMAYRDIGVFLLQLNHALCPRLAKTGDHKTEEEEQKTEEDTTGPELRQSSTSAAPPSTLPSLRLPRRAPVAPAATLFTLDQPRKDPPSVQRLQQLLAKMAALMDEAPPDPGPRRFGNASFRVWHRLLAERADALLGEYVWAGQTTGYCEADGEVGSELAPATAADEVRAYFLGSFGSSQRLDYGTGHELSFLAFLGCLWKLGRLQDDDGGNGEEDGDEYEDSALERSIVLGVVEPYLQVVRRLIQTYTLEPAGSHGVWGLDDHSFLPYIFGSAQLVRPLASATEPMPQQGSAPRAPKPTDILKPMTVAVQRERNLYFSAIGFINDVKRGAFWEHSPILYDVSGITDGWGKINKGMLKMYDAEVLAKFPVIQHFPFGSLFSWDVDPRAAPPAPSMHLSSQPVAAAPFGGGGGGDGSRGGGGGSGGAMGTTTAPWARPSLGARAGIGATAGTGGGGILGSRGPTGPPSPVCAYDGHDDECTRQQHR